MRRPEKCSMLRSCCRLSLFNTSLHACGGGFTSGLCVDGGLLCGLLFSGHLLVRQEVLACGQAVSSEDGDSHSASVQFRHGLLNHADLGKVLQGGTQVVEVTRAGQGIEPGHNCDLQLRTVNVEVDIAQEPAGQRSCMPTAMLEYVPPKLVSSS